MSDTRINIIFKSESEGYETLRSVIYDLCEIKSEYEADESGIPFIDKELYFSEIPSAISIELEKIATNPWFWDFSLEWNDSLDDEGNDCISIDYFLSEDSSEIKELKKWFKFFKPLKVSLEESDGYDEGRMCD